MNTFDMETVRDYTGRPGFTGKFVHGEGFTLARWEIKKGSELSFHNHPHEQTTLLLSGKLEIGNGDEKTVLTPGQGITFAGGEGHGGVALEDCLLIDVFCPAREDFKILMG